MRVIVPWAKISCPACSHRFHLNSAERRLTGDGVSQEPDLKLAAFLSRPSQLLNQVIPPPKANLLNVISRSMIVPDDGRQNWKKVCPNCHFPLPHKTAIGEVRSRPFAIIGARSAGKSNFFAVLLKQLERRYGPEVGFSIYGEETLHVKDMKIVGSEVLYRERYGDRLWDPDDRMAVDQTKSLSTDGELRIPLIYRIEAPKQLHQIFTRPFAYANSINAVIFDAAGEDMNDPDRMRQYYKFLSGAAGIIFLIDPFQYPGLRELLPADVRKRTKIEVDPTEIVSKVLHLFEQQAGLKSGQKVKVPVAFALTKSDMLRGMVHASSPILRDSTHDRGFNREDSERVSEDIAQMIKDKGGGHLVHLAASRFQTHRFFAVSALGELPDEHMRIRSVSPLRVADPLLWLLWKLGYIPAQRKP